MKPSAILLLCPFTVLAAVNNVRVIGASATQAVIAFVAPDFAPCTVEVSEEPAYAPLVPDVNPAYYSGANLDTREGSAVRGRERMVVIGKRVTQRALDNRVYSRALQAATTHYYRITCGPDTATGTFQTRTIPFGDTHGDPPIPDPDNPGQTLFPTSTWSRNSITIDPHTGAQVRLVQTGLDSRHIESSGFRNFASVTSSANWTNAVNALDSDTDTADYDGASCGETCDWLILSMAPVSNPGTASRTDLFEIEVIGSASSGNPSERDVEIAIMSLGTNTVDPNSRLKELRLSQSPAFATQITANSGTVDTWRIAGKVEINVWTGDVLRFGIRKKSPGGTISIRQVRLNRVWSKASYNGSSGAFERCSSILRPDDRYLCNTYVQGGISMLYSIHKDSGDVRYLGLMYDPGYNTGVSSDNAMWDHTDPNCLYFINTQVGNRKYCYTGDGSDRAVATTGVHTVAAAAVTTLPVTGAGTNMTLGVKNFVAANIGHYPFAFDDTKFGCGPVNVMGDYLALACARATQDTYGWIAAYKISTGDIVAASPMFARPASRWCRIHTPDNIGNQPAIQVALQVGKNLAVGNGAYLSTVVGSYSAYDTNLTLTSICSGTTCTGHFDGEPVSATYADNYLMPHQVGDVALWGSEYVRIVSKASSKSVTVARGQFGTTPVSHASGTTLNFFCCNQPGAGPNLYVGAEQTLIWRFLDDPYGEDATGKYQWMNKVISHQISRGNVLANVIDLAVTTKGTNILPTVPDPPVTISINQAPYFARKYAPTDGNLYQKHPNLHPDVPGYLFDVWPFIGGDLISDTTPGCDPNVPDSCAASRVSGLTNVYRYRFNNLVPGGTTPNPDGMNPKQHAQFGVSGGLVLRDCSGPGSRLDDSPAKDYCYCHALSANECVTGSTAGQWYVQVPGVAAYYCTDGNSGKDICLSDFAYNALSATQFGYHTPNKDGNVFTSAKDYGHGWSRSLVRMATKQGWRNMSGFASVKVLPNGKWALATRWDSAQVSSISGTNWMTYVMSLLKIPPAIKDSVNRSTFVPVRIAIPSVPAGTSNVVVEFGYGEHGAPGSLHCTSRAETCVAVRPVIDEANPFYWASETYSGLPCASGCAPVIPAYPERVVYYRLKFRNASDQVLFTGPIQIALAP